MAPPKDPPVPSHIAAGQARRDAQTPNGASKADRRDIRARVGELHRAAPDVRAVPAEAIFAEKGATDSTEEVANRAGVAICTILRHLPTRRS